MRTKESMKISIIIPVLNEENYISNILEYLADHCTDGTSEVIVVDGGSIDATVSLAHRAGVKVLKSERGRARQMNLGARNAIGEILYFLHVDTFPPANFEKAIIKAVNDGYASGCFQMRFDSNSRFLRFFAWFTRVNHRLCRGGDQSLFISRELFDLSGGFDEDYQVYEDTEFITRLYKLDRFTILPQQVVTSARRYRHKGTYRLQYHFGMIHLKRLFGASPQKLHKYYLRYIAT